MLVFADGGVGIVLFRRVGGLVLARCEKLAAPVALFIARSV